MPDITIRIEKGTQTAGDGQELQESQGQKSELSAGKVASISTFQNFAISTLKRSINYGIANVGNLTGDYIMQQQLETAASIVEDATMVVSGFAAGGIYGGIIAIAGVAIKQGMNTASFFIDVYKSNINQDLLRQRSGNSLIDGSRGGNE